MPSESELFAEWYQFRTKNSEMAGGSFKPDFGLSGDRKLEIE